MISKYKIVVNNRTKYNMSIKLAELNKNNKWHTV